MSVKRLTDAGAAALGLIALSPVLVIILIAVWSQDRKSPFYIAPRRGRYGRPFRMVKIRSMVTGADRSGLDTTAADDMRITPLGHFIRRWKLDELMQLWNVLKGEMSLVGPRPNTLAESATYTDAECELLSVRPGITDISSIAFSDEGDIVAGAADPASAYRRLIWPWKAQLGILYVRRRSVALDFQLIFLTIVAIIDKQRSLRMVGRMVTRLGGSAELAAAATRVTPLEDLADTPGAGVAVPAILWLHNQPAVGGMFMHDIQRELAKDPSITLIDHAIPVRPSIRALGHTVSAAGNPARLRFVHAQYGSLVGAVGRRIGRPMILTLRGSDIYAHPGRFRTRLGGVARRFLTWWGARSAAVIVVMSHAMRDRIRRWPGLRAHAIAVIPDPSGMAFWPGPSQSLTDVLRHRPLRVVSASFQRDNPVKRGWIVEEAVALLRAIGLPVEFSYLQGLERTEVADHLRRGDVLALSSTHEGWPNIVKEAMLSGCAFVATDVGDLARWAGERTPNLICDATPLDFALAFADVAGRKALAVQAPEIDPDLVQFHPEVVAIKHRIVYSALATDQVRR